MRIAAVQHIQIQCRFSNSASSQETMHTKAFHCSQLHSSYYIAQDIDMEFINRFMGYTNIYNIINNPNMRKITIYLFMASAGE